MRLKLSLFLFALVIPLGGQRLNACEHRRLNSGINELVCSLPGIPIITDFLHPIDRLIFTSTISACPDGSFSSLRTFTNISVIFMDFDMRSLPQRCFNGGPHEFDTITIHSNAAEDFDLSSIANLPRVRSLELNGLPISRIADGTLTAWTHAPHLRSLTLNSNQLVEIEPNAFVSSFGNLTTLKLTGQPYGKSLLANAKSWSAPLSSLSAFSLDNTPCSDCPSIELGESLRFLSLKKCQLKNIETLLANVDVRLQELDLSYNVLSNGGKGPLCRYKNLNSLDLSHNELAFDRLLPRSVCQNRHFKLLKLISKGNRISHVYLNHIPRPLTTLDLGSSTIKRIQGKGNSLLEEVDLSNMVIDPHGFSPLFDYITPSVKKLRLANCNLNDDSLVGIGLAGMKRLQLLDLSGNNIKSIPDNLLGVKSLYLRANDISHVITMNTDRQESSLRFLDLRDNRIRRIDRCSYVIGLDRSAGEASQSNDLLLSGNPLECECTNAWIHKEGACSLESLGCDQLESCVLMAAAAHGADSKAIKVLSYSPSTQKLVFQFNLAVLEKELTAPTHQDLDLITELNGGDKSFMSMATSKGLSKPGKLLYWPLKQTDHVHTKIILKEGKTIELSAVDHNQEYVFYYTRSAHEYIYQLIVTTGEEGTSWRKVLAVIGSISLVLMVLGLLVCCLWCIFRRSNRKTFTAGIKEFRKSTRAQPMVPAAERSIDNDSMPTIDPPRLYTPRSPASSPNALHNQSSLELDDTYMEISNLQPSADFRVENPYCSPKDLLPKRKPTFIKPPPKPR